MILVIIIWVLIFLAFIALLEESSIDIYVDTQKSPLKRKHRIVYFITSLIRLVSGVLCGLLVLLVLTTTIVDISDGTFLEASKVMFSDLPQSMPTWLGVLFLAFGGVSICCMLILIEVALFRLLKYIESCSGIVFKNPDDNIIP